jgi:site-specific DNA recombinase
MVNEKFKSIVDRLTLNKKFNPLLKNLLIKELKAETNEATKNIKILESRMTGLKNNREKLDHRFAIEGTINSELYNKMSPKLDTEIKEVLEELTKLKENSSNIENCADDALNFLQNISECWSYSDYNKKRELQNLMFPTGMTYNKKNDVVRTENYNNLILWVTRHQQDLEKNKAGIPELNLSYAGLVAGE